MEQIANLVRQQLMRVAVLMVVFVVDMVALLPAGATCAHDLIAQSWIR